MAGPLLLGAAVARSSAPLGRAIDAAIPEGGFIGRLFDGARLRWRLRLVDDGMPAGQLTEVAGVVHGADRAAGAAPGFEELVRAQAALDIGEPAAGSPGVAYGAVARGLSFALGAGKSGEAGAGARLVVGRSFSLLGAGDGGDAASGAVVVAFVRSDQAIPFAAVTWPGMVGAVTGVNAEGIAVMLHPAPSSDVRLTRAAQATPLFARDGLERLRAGPRRQGVDAPEAAGALAERGAEVAARDGNRIDRLGAQFSGEPFQLFGGQVSQIGRMPHPVEEWSLGRHAHGRSFTALLCLGVLGAHLKQQSRDILPPLPAACTTTNYSTSASPSGSIETN